MICGSEGSKSRLAKAAAADSPAQMRNAKLHAVVARSTFSSQNVQNTPFSAHFGELRMWKNCTPLRREALFKSMYKTRHSQPTLGNCECGKIALRCGAKHFSNQCTKHAILSPLWGIANVEKLYSAAAKHFSNQCTKHAILSPLLEV